MLALLRGMTTKRTGATPKKTAAAATQRLAQTFVKDLRQQGLTASQIVEVTSAMIADVTEQMRGRRA